MRTKQDKETEQPIRPIRQQSIDHLTRETMALLARENEFPMRVRWQYAQSLARLVNLADLLSYNADGINPASNTEYSIHHDVRVRNAILVDTPVS